MSAQRLLQRALLAVVEADVGVSLFAAKRRPLESINKALRSVGAPRAQDTSEGTLQRVVRALENA
jgi:hypothetical protein